MVTPVYCSATQVSELLQISTFTSTSSPTFTQVETIINRKEDRIDRKLGHSWREKTVTDLFLDLTFVEMSNGVRFDLPNYSIRSLVKLEVWNGTEYVDFVQDKTEGRGDDYWIDKDLGIVWVRTEVKTNTRKPIRVTYTFGELTVDLDVEDLCVLYAAIDVLNMYPLAISIADDGNSQTNNQQQRIDNFDKQIKSILGERNSISTF